MDKRWDYNELYKFSHKAERLTLQGNFKEVIPMMKELFQGFYEAQDIIDIFVRYLSFITKLCKDDFESYKEISSLIQIRELLLDKEYLYSFSKVRKADFFPGVFAESEDLYLFIVHEYYSTDDESWFKRIADFFDGIYLIINYTIEYHVYEFMEKFLDPIHALEFYNTNGYPYRFHVVNNRLEMSDKAYLGFTLNIKKILEDEAYGFILRDHLKRYYNKEDKKKIIEHLHRYDEIRIWFPLDDLL